MTSPSRADRHHHRRPPRTATGSSAPTAASSRSAPPPSTDRRAACSLQRPVVGITPTADEGGYWLVASDGGIFAFGDAGFHGSIPGSRPCAGRIGPAPRVERAHRRHGAVGRRWWLLHGRVGRWRVRLRRRAVRGLVPGDRGVQRGSRGRRARRHRPGLLARHPDRRRVHLRGRSLLRCTRTAGVADHRRRCAPPTGAGTTSSWPTARSTAMETPCRTAVPPARSAASIPPRRSSPTPAAAGTGWLRPREASSPMATRRTTGPWRASHLNGAIIAGTGF